VLYQLNYCPATYYWMISAVYVQYVSGKWDSIFLLLIFPDAYAYSV
jgi:hypothetical protein